MDDMMKMDMKKKLWEQIMGYLDGEEAMKIKPKEDMGGDSSMPKSMDADGEMEQGMGMSEGAMGEDDDEMDDESLKSLMKSYLGKC